MLLTGPMPVAAWARHDYQVMTAFEGDATLVEDRLPSFDLHDRRMADRRQPIAGSHLAPS
jgi:hypothetical protein